MGQRGEELGGSKPNQGEPCRPLQDFGFSSGFHLKEFFWLLGGEENIRWVEAGRTVWRVLQ